MTDQAFQSATELATSIRSKKVSSLELLDYYIGRVERFNPPLNAIVVKDYDRARDQARAADDVIAKGDAVGPLHGVPMTIKDSYNVAGLPTTWGIPELRDNIADTDALSVQRLKRAGAILFGKTNVPLRLADLQSYNEIYGTTNNPWDLERGPGGSSGGSAAALAAGLTGFDSGSDIGSSIRNPAHYCGVFGHKPTWELLPMRGHALPGVLTPTDLSVIGPLARSAEDLRIGVEVMAGPDELAGRGLKLDLPEPTQKSLADFKVAVWLDNPRCPIDGPVRDRLEEAVEALEKAGASVDRDARPDIDMDQAYKAYVHLLNSAMASRVSDDEFNATLKTAFAYDVDDTSKHAVTARRNLFMLRDWSASNERRQHMRWAWHEFFKGFDAILTPMCATTAFKHDHSDGPRLVSVNGEMRPYMDSVFWAGVASAPYLPSTLAPLGPTSDGLPAGIQIIGPEYSDLITIELARLLTLEIGGYSPPPGYED